VAISVFNSAHPEPFTPLILSLSKNLFILSPLEGESQSEGETQNVGIDLQVCPTVRLKIFTFLLVTLIFAFWSLIPLPPYC